MVASVQLVVSFSVCLRVAVGDSRRVGRTAALPREAHGEEVCLTRWRPLLADWLAPAHPTLYSCLLDPAYAWPFAAIILSAASNSSCPSRNARPIRTARSGRPASSVSRSFTQSF